MVGENSLQLSGVSSQGESSPSTQNSPTQICAAEFPYNSGFFLLALLKVLPRLKNIRFPLVLLNFLPEVIMSKQFCMGLILSP